MMGRHKKKLKEDKAKIKLKQTKTKFLPKGLNETKTDFKIKPIVLLEQLKEKDSSTAISKRKLDVKDLLNRLKHYNENIRFGACEELSEMIKIHSEELTNVHLPQIITNVSSLMQDQEHKVRKSAAKVIRTILEIVPDAKVEAFFKYFSTNIRCAMTNIDKRIQEDSLLFLDCFLMHKSSFIPKTSEKLLPAFFTLISKLRSDSDIQRTLTLNLGSKMTTVTWRLKVLSRLHAVMESIIQGQSLEKVTKTDVVIDGTSRGYFPLYKEPFGEALENSGLNFFDSSNERNEDVLNRYIVTLVPLLYEIWMEVVPQKNIGKGVEESTYLNDGAAAILSCVMKTLYLLWQYVKGKEDDTLNIKTVFLSNDGRKFISHLLTNFPYCQTDGRNKQSKSTDVSLALKANVDPKCVAENLLICYMYCVLKLSLVPIKMRIEMEAITAYVTKCLSTKKYVDQNSSKYLILFLKTCLVEDTTSWKRAGADMKAVLESAIAFYHHNTVGEKCTWEVFHILCEVVDIPYLKSLPCYRAWLSSLPDLLCGPKIMDTTIKELLNLSKKGVQPFHEAIRKKLPQILDNLGSLKVVLTSHTPFHSDEMMKRHVIYILCYVPRLDEEVMTDYISKVDRSSFHLCLTSLQSSLRSRKF